MLRDFVFPDDVTVLARRYGLIAGLRALWELLNLDPVAAFWALLPPLDLFVIALHDLDGPIELFLPGLVWLLLSALQFGLALGAVRLVHGRLFPSSPAEPESEPAAMATAAELDGQGLQRPWWISPLLMALSLIFACYLVWWLLSMLRDGKVMPIDWTIYGGGLWPLAIGLGLSLIGVISGSRFIRSASAAVGDLAGVTYLGDDHWLTRRVHTLADRLELPRPTVGIMSSRNAFAVGSGRSKAAVVIGQPLINELTPAELDAVIGHELGHIASNDMQSMQFAAGFQEMLGGSVRLATGSGAQISSRQSTAMLVVAVGTLLHRTVLIGSDLLMKLKSRSREFYADAIGGALTSPDAMIGALEKVHSAPAPSSAVENRYGYLMFRGGGALGRLFATHPTFEQRRNALHAATYLKNLPRRRLTQASPGPSSA